MELNSFKLAGNALAAVAGVVGAYYDFKDGQKAQDEQKVALMLGLYARSVTNGLAIGAGVALGYSYSGPLLESWAKRAGGNVVLEGLAGGAEWLAVRRAWLFAATWWITFTVIALSFVVGMLSDDAMQKWVKRSGFRKLGKPEDGTDPLYAKPGEELAELYNAFKAVTSP